MSKATHHGYEAEAIPAWGIADPRRGANHRETASAFVRHFPIGTKLTVDDFDKWAVDRGLLTMPPGKSRTSDAWKAHVIRRHVVKDNINAAGPHPETETPFVVDVFVSGAEWVVRAPHAAIKENAPLHDLKTLAATKRRKLSYLMQCTDWPKLPPEIRVLTKMIYEDIANMERKTELEFQCLHEKILLLESKVTKALG